MGYTITEVNKKNKDDFKELAECMRTIQWHNERGIFAGNVTFMGHQGYDIPKLKEYIEFIKNIVNIPSAKLFFAKEDCCGEKVVGVAFGGFTEEAEESKTRCGRIMFFWVNPDFRKTKLPLTLYKKLFGWFKKNNCPNVSVTFNPFQNDMSRFFVKNGYRVANVELVGPVEVM